MSLSPVSGSSSRLSVRSAMLPRVGLRDRDVPQLGRLASSMTLALRTSVRGESSVAIGLPHRRYLPRLWSQSSSPFPDTPATCLPYLGFALYLIGRWRIEA